MIGPIFMVLEFLQLLGIVTAQLPEIPKTTADITKNPDIVTICNSTYCDKLEPVCWCHNESDLHYYITSQAGLRHSHQVSCFEKKNIADPPLNIRITIDPCKKYQKIECFGGALTDASAININCLSEKTRKCLMDSLFDCDIGIGIYCLRVPLGGTDFSLKPYTYDDQTDPDPCLANFTLNEMDTCYKIPIINEAKNISCRFIIIKVATWRLPDWAKISKTENLTQILEQIGVVSEVLNSQLKAGKELVNRYYVKPEYYCAMARYILRAMTEYCKLGVKIQIVSPGNEVFLGLVSDAWNRDDYKNWVSKYLYPILQNYPCLVDLTCLDDQTPILPYWSQISDYPCTKCSSYGIHWYLDRPLETVTPILNCYCNKYPDLGLLNTESSVCKTDVDYNTSNDWEKFVRLADDMITKLLTCLQGYLYWNLVLDMQGGPNWLGNYCYAPIVVNCTNVNCTNCTKVNCANCTNVNCTSCTNCTNSINCKNNANCKNRTNCTNEDCATCANKKCPNANWENLVNSKDCDCSCCKTVNCTNCTNEDCPKEVNCESYTSVNCTSCTNCTNLNCTDCPNEKCPYVNCANCTNVNCTNCTNDCLDYFIKRVMYYGIGHFTKFVPCGSVRIEATVTFNNASTNTTLLRVVAFEVYSPSCTCSKTHIIIIVLNPDDLDIYDAEICYNCGKCAKVYVPKQSIITFVALKPSD